MIGPAELVSTGSERCTGICLRKRCSCARSCTPYRRPRRCTARRSWPGRRTRWGRSWRSSCTRNRSPTERSSTGRSDEAERSRRARKPSSSTARCSWCRRRCPGHMRRSRNTTPRCPSIRAGPARAAAHRRVRPWEHPTRCRRRYRCREQSGRARRQGGPPSASRAPPVASVSMPQPPASTTMKMTDPLRRTSSV